MLKINYLVMDGPDWTDCPDREVCQVYSDKYIHPCPDGPSGLVRPGPNIYEIFRLDFKGKMWDWQFI